MSQQAVVAARGWSIEGFRRFWAKPDLALMPRLSEMMTPDIVGYWPRPIGTVHGAAAYSRVIAAIWAVCPDFSVSGPDYARDGDLHFVRWVATGTAARGRFEANGIDRVRTTPDGFVAENYVCCDHPFFAEVQAYLGREG